MGQIKIVLPDDVEQAFRKAAMEKFMYQKGAVSRAAKMMITKWIFENCHNEKSNSPIKKDPVGAIEGILKHVKKTSVELQHEVGEHIAGKYIHRY